MIRYGQAYVDEGAEAYKTKYNEFLLKSGKAARSRDSEDIKNEGQIQRQNRDLISKTRSIRDEYLIKWFNPVQKPDQIFTEELR
jgi:hypothetical protein